MIASVFILVSLINEEILSPGWLKESRDIAREFYLKYVFE